MTTKENHFNDFTINTDKDTLDIPVIHEYLSTRSYWAAGRSLECVEKSIENSLCFGVYKGENQIGFARVVTDFATFSWLCDVFILEDYRGRGLGKWLISTLVEYQGIKGSTRFFLATKDAHNLYSKYGGFEKITMPEKLMVKSGK